jgi:hypothetical protein
MISVVDPAVARGGRASARSLQAKLLGIHKLEFELMQTRAAAKIEKQRLLSEHKRDMLVCVS